jgi:hypothetical protein
MLVFLNAFALEEQPVHFVNLFPGNSAFVIFHWYFLSGFAPFT